MRVWWGKNMLGLVIIIFTNCAVWRVGLTFLIISILVCIIRTLNLHHTFLQKLNELHLIDN